MTYNLILGTIANTELEGWTAGSELRDVDLSTVKALRATLKAVRKDSGKVIDQTKLWRVAMDVTSELRYTSGVALASCDDLIEALENATLGDSFLNLFDVVFGKSVDDVLETLLQTRDEVATKQKAIIKLEVELHKVAGQSVPSYLTGGEFFVR